MKFHFHSYLLLFFLLSSLSSLHAQKAVLRAAQLFDAATGRMVSPAVVVIDGNRIESINPAQLPKDAEVIDLKDMTLLPGLIDVHVHITGNLALAQRSRTAMDSEVKETASDRTIRGIINAETTLKAGFTTVRDLGSGDFTAVSLARASQAGLIPAPRIIPAGYPLSITGGHGDAGGYIPGVAEGGPETGIADGVDEVTKAVRYQIKHGAKVIKIMATAGVLSFEGPSGAQQYTETEMRAAVEEAARHGIKVTAHAHGLEGTIAAIKAGIASIEHGSTLDAEAIRLMKEKGTYLVPTVYIAERINLDALPPVMRRKAEEVMPVSEKSVKEAIKSGVNIAFGTDAAVIPHGENAKQFDVLVRMGMQPVEAIRSATIYAAKLLETPDRGQLKAGLLADIIAVQGNPLENVKVLEEVKFVMKDGKVYK